jgi:hypothetical protein
MRLSALAAVLALVMVLSGCDAKQTSPPPVGDTTPPSTVSNLEVIGPPGPVVTLAWTAPGDDGDVGRAARYDIRRARAATALPLPEEMQPLPVGTAAASEAIGEKAALYTDAVTEEAGTA